MTHILVRAFRLPRRDGLMAVEALWALALARLLLLILPFPTAMAWLGLQMGSAMAVEGNAAMWEIRNDVKTAVRRASRVAPFRAVCLQQAVAASVLLRRRGLASEIHFGVARPDRSSGQPGDSLTAHAWTTCAGETVTGGANKEGFVPIAIFVPRRI